jgi:outer membrane immunogenic protein
VFVFAASGAANATDVYSKGSFKDAGFGYAPITWTGFYLGGHAGVSLTDELAFSYKDEGLKVLDGFSLDNAFVGGVQIGYNRQTLSNWVYGIEADLSFLDDGLDGDIDLTEFLASIRGRLGIASGTSLVYLTGGVAFLGYSDEFTRVFSDEFTKLDDTAIGFVVGGGIEHKLRSNFSVGIEGLYYNFSSDIEDTAQCGCFQTADLDRDFWVIRARASYHFTSGYDDPLK